MKASLQRIYTEDSIELVGILYEPENPTNKVLTHVHGMSGNFYENKFLDHIAKALTDEGFAFFAFNNRGCEFLKDLYKVENGSRKVVRIGDALERFEDCVFDISAAINFLEQHGFSDIHLAGHSLGSPKVAFYLAETKDKRIKSAVMISPSDMHGLVRQEEEKFERDITEATRLVSSGEERKLLSHELWEELPISAGTYLSLFADTSKAGIFNFLDPEGSFETLSKISVPVFAVMGRKDDASVVPVEQAFQKLTNALSSSPRVETKILGDANHGFIGDEQNLADALIAWLATV